MQTSSSPKDSWQQRSLWIGVVSVAAVALGISLFEILFLTASLSRAAVVTVSLFVAALLSRYDVKIPGTQINFSAKEIFSFWGVIWLGVSGGVVLSTCASIANNGLSSPNRRRLVSNIASDVLATCFSAVAFFLALKYLGDPTRHVAIGGLSIPSQVLIASCFMALTHLSQRSALVFLFRGSVSGAGAAVGPQSFIAMSAVTGVSLLATILLFVAFNHFGIEFGLVFIPIAIIGDLAYKFHRRSVEQQTKLISESSRIHLATVEALATAIDAREQVGVGHVRRTQIYAVGIGSILGLGEDEINALRTGALLHDIGKLAVPDHILSKPGRLTPAEMEKIKTHSLVGASILEKVGFPYPVVPTVKYHHEFWNGEGYPEGLHGGSIPLTARILAIADCYDTLRGARPYRAAVSHDEACNFLRSRAGSQFDPRLVDLFLRNLKIFEAEIAAQHLTYETDREAVNMSTMVDSGASPNYVEQIKRANREVFTLYSLARDFSSELDLDEILSLFTEKIRELVPFDTSIVYLLDETRHFAEAAHVDGKYKDVLLSRRIAVGEGATGYVLNEGKSARNLDPSFDFSYWNPELTGEYCAMVSLPLLADEKLVGAISLYSSELPAYQDEHIRLLETISRIAADAICRSQEHAVTENYALTDPMTGLPNARSLQMHFEKEVKRASRSDGSFQLLVLDLDGFKSVNDTHGHKAGDNMLKEIGEIIKGQLREYDFLARYGGDEFVAIVPDTDSTDVMELARRIEEAVQDFTLVVGDGQSAKVGVSIGTACYPIHGETFDQIIVSADKAMYLTKGFHRKRTGGRPSSDPALRLPVSLPDEIATFASVKGRSRDGLILEVDETHIVSSSAIN